MTETAAKEKPATRAGLENARSTRRSRAGKPGRPEWQPARQILRRGGVQGEETQEAAWERARNFVKVAAVAGMQHEVICNQVSPPCSLDTLYKYFRAELDHGKEMVTQAIVSALVRDALNGSGSNQRFYLQTQAGWKREDNLKLTGVLHVKNIAGDEEE